MSIIPRESFTDEHVRDYATVIRSALDMSGHFAGELVRLTAQMERIAAERDFQDRRVQRYIQELESADPPLTPDQWRMVVEGHGEKIARACGRASNKEKGHSL